MRVAVEIRLRNTLETRNRIYLPRASAGRTELRRASPNWEAKRLTRRAMFGGTVSTLGVAALRRGLNVFAGVGLKGLLHASQVFEHHLVREDA